MKFRVGEIVIVVTGPVNRAYVGQLNAGDEVEIVAAGPFSSGAKLSGPGPNCTSNFSLKSHADYECRHPAGFHFHTLESRLRKRHQGLPSSVLEIFQTKEWTSSLTQVCKDLTGN